MKAKKLKKGLILLVSFAMVLTMSITTSFASTTTTVNDFEDLKAAVAAGGDITLGDNIVMTDQINVVNSTVTLDLNGKTLSNTSDIWSSGHYAYFAVGSNGNLTINGDGTLKTKENDCYAITVSGGGKCTINGGTYLGNVSVIYIETEGGTVEINGGRFAIQQLSNGLNDYRYTLNCLDAEYVAGTAKFIVNGGEFFKFNPGNDLSEGEGTNFLGNGFVSVEANDSYYHVVPVNVDTTAPSIPTVTVDKVAAGVSDAAKAVVEEATSALVEAVANGDTTGIDADLVAAIEQALLDEVPVTTEIYADNMDAADVKQAEKDKIAAVMKDSADTNKAKNPTLVQYLDLGININIDGEAVGEVTELNAPIEFSIAVPTNVNKAGRVFYVVRVHNGEATKLDTVMNNGILTFKTDKFSTYALVYEEKADTTTGTTGNTGNTGSQTGTVKTGDATDMSLYLGMSLVAMIAALGLIFKKLRTDK